MTTSGSILIMQERNRQATTLGYYPEHDLMHADEELVRAAIAYALPHNWRARIIIDGASLLRTALWALFWIPEWEWKPTGDDRVRELVKAGALIAAEIDRLQLKEKR